MEAERRPLSNLPTDQEARIVTRAIDRSPDGVVLVDRGGLIRYANPAACSLMGRDPADLVDMPFGEPLHTDRQSEIEVIDSSGRVHLVEMRATPMRAQGEDVWVVALHDATAHMDTERSLLGALQQRDDALSFASHELRSPLTVIIGMVQSVLHHWDALDADTRAQLLRSIEQHALRMDHTLTRLVDAVRVDAGMFRAEPERLILLDVLLARLTELGDTATLVNLEIPSHLAVHADPDHVWTMVSNLVSNAGKYGDPPIEVRGSEDGSDVLIEVRDGGEGVPQEHVPFLFSRYGRAKRHENVEGTGLGLWIVHAAAAANRGVVGYRQRAGGGACFWIRLPRAGQAA